MTSWRSFVNQVSKTKILKQPTTTYIHSTAGKQTASVQLGLLVLKVSEFKMDLRSTSQCRSRCEQLTPQQEVAFYRSIDLQGESVWRDQTNNPWEVFKVAQGNKAFAQLLEGVHAAIHAACWPRGG